MISDAEMTRLRVQFLELPGLNPVGLFMYHGPNSEIRSLCFDEHGDSGIIENPRGADPFGRPVTVDLPATACISLADAATADRVARWVAERERMHPAATAPSFRFIRIGYPPALRPNLLWGSIGCSFDTPADIDPKDDRCLPDGSRWVDRVALAEVARYVGRPR